MATSPTAWAAIVALLVLYLLVAALAGAAGSPLVPPLPRGVAVPGWTVALGGWLGLDGLSRTAATAVGVGVLAGAVAAFAVLVGEAWRGRVATAPAVVAAVIAVTLATAAPLLLSRDVHSYASYGRILAVHGANPYVEPPASFPDDPFTPVVSSAWLDTVSRYGPAFTLVSGAVAGASADSPGATVVAFKALAAVGVIAAMGFSIAACRRVRPDRVALAAVIVGLNPVLVVHTVGGGHNDALVAAGVAAGLALALRHAIVGRSPVAPSSHSPVRPVAMAATACLTLAAMVKVVAAIPLLVWWWSLARTARPGERMRVAAWHAGLAAAVVAALVLPFAAGRRSLVPLVSLAALQGWASGPRLVARGARALGEAIGGDAAGAALAGLAFGAFLALFAWLLWTLLRRATPDRSADTWGGTTLGFALSAPYLIPWYAAWFLPLLPAMRDRVLLVTGLAVAGILSLTGIPAEPAGDPGLYDAMLLAVHYAAAPAMLVLLFVTARRLVSGEPLEPDPARSPAPAGWPP